MTLPRATPVIALLSVGVTLLHHLASWAVSVLFHWALDADARHAASDIGALTLGGVLFEPRSGPVRTAVWLGAGVIASHASTRTPRRCTA